jgi:hypothetical protein
MLFGVDTQKLQLGFFFQIWQGLAFFIALRFVVRTLVDGEETRGNFTEEPLAVKV